MVLNYCTTNIKLKQVLPNTELNCIVYRSHGRRHRNWPPLESNSVIALFVIICWQMY